MNNTQVDFHDSRADDINDGLSQSLKPNDNPNQRSVSIGAWSHMVVVWLLLCHG